MGFVSCIPLNKSGSSSHIDSWPFHPLPHYIIIELVTVAGSIMDQGLETVCNTWLRKYATKFSDMTWFSNEMTNLFSHHAHW